jgi:7-cyano-7-deazaguanine reductase
MGAGRGQDSGVSPGRARALPGGVPPRKWSEALTIATLDNAYPERPYEIELEALELTSLCPLTGAPDFGTLLIRYVPAQKLVELKSLRDFLTAYRQRQILQEELVNEVLEAIVAAAEPRSCEVKGIFNPRGGITARVVARMGENPERA